MKLYEFPMSHFCEKARFALDYKNVSYSRIPNIPAVHFFFTKLILRTREASPCRF